MAPHGQRLASYDWVCEQEAEHLQLVTRLEDDLQSAVLRQGPDTAVQSQGSTAQQPGNSMLGIVTNQRDRFRRRCACWTEGCEGMRRHAGSAADGY